MVATEHTFEKIAELLAGALAREQERPPFSDDPEPIEGECLPVLGTRPVGDVEPMELVQLAKGIESHGASDMAKRILQIRPPPRRACSVSKGQILKYP